jgi:MinD superfamily P-loop ATPase
VLLRALTISKESKEAHMVTAQDKPRSRLEEASPTQCPRCKALMKVRKYVPLPGRKFVDVDYRCDGCGAEILRVVPCER